MKLVQEATPGETSESQMSSTVFVQRGRLVEERADASSTSSMGRLMTALIKFTGYPELSLTISHDKLLITDLLL